MKKYVWIIAVVILIAICSLIVFSDSKCFVSKNPKSADINKDGVVNKYDFSIMMANWNHKGFSDCDLNNDNRVNNCDLNILIENWSK